jgi:gamma-glutamyltranspeptidase/glutathione hydrolase
MSDHPLRARPVARRAAARLLVLPLLAACTYTSTTSTTGTGMGAGGTVTPGTLRTAPDGAPTIAPREPARFPDGWRFPAGARAEFAPNAMAVSNSRLASAAAVEILERGGNAVDAAVALGFALAVTWPEAGNIGGGGYMVIRLADGRTAALDYREVAPRAATRDMYLDANGQLTDRSIVGHLASGVPGAVAGLARALERYGTLPLREVMQPAIRLAREGFVVDTGLASSIRNSERVRPFDGAARFFPGGQPLAAGARLVQPELARTLQAIADHGPAGFYRGWVADSLVAEMQRGGGILTHADLAAYTPRERRPIRSTYRGFTLLAMPPSSSGGVTMTESLNILETWPSPGAHGSAAWYHRVASAYQRAFVDRNGKLGDPEFVPVPLDQLTSKVYAQQLRRTIQETRATPTRDVDAAMQALPREPMNTTHYSVVDRAGNAVATTTTLNGSWGSGVWVRGAGFFLNNEMDDFAAQPGVPNMFGLVQGEQNAIEPGKRMLSAMSPTIVLDSAQQVLLVAGAAGGPTIITGTSQVILNVLDHRMSLADAMRAPRLHHQALPDSLTVEIDGVAPAVQDSLRAMGWALRPIRTLVNVNAIMRVRGGWEGVYEPRRTGGAVGH